LNTIATQKIAKKPSLESFHKITGWLSNT